MSTLDTTQCPLCQQHNHCGLNGKEPCWCTQVKIAPALIAKVPTELQRKACICLACVNKFNLELGQEVY